MSKLAVLTAIFVFAITAGGQESDPKPRRKLDADAMYFTATHLSVEDVDFINYKAGRQMTWKGIPWSFAGPDASVEAIEIPVDTLEGYAREETLTPAWVSEIQEKGKAYQAEREKKAESYEDRLSEYSQKEINIAESMQLLPWEIDRNQLKKWAE